MSKQLRSLQVSRCAAIAIFLIAMAEGFRQIALAGLSTWQWHPAAMLAFATILFLLTSAELPREGSKAPPFSETDQRLQPVSVQNGSQGNCLGRGQRKMGDGRQRSIRMSRGVASAILRCP